MDFEDYQNSAKSASQEQADADAQMIDTSNQNEAKSPKPE